MNWHTNTVPYSFHGCDVRGYADDNNGAWLIEHDRNDIAPYFLYRFDNDNAKQQWQLIANYHTLHGAKRRAEKAAE